MTAFELQPTLQGELVQLRPLRPDDFPALFEVANDPLIWEQHPSRDRYKREVFEDFFLGAIESGGALLALDAETREVIGSSRYLSLSLGEVEIGYTFLARRCWGHTYNREMKSLMLAHAFRFVPEVVFVIGEKNQRSRAAIQKIGAALDAEAPGEGSVRYRLARP